MLKNMRDEAHKKITIEIQQQKWGNNNHKGRRELKIIDKRKHQKQNNIIKIQIQHQ
jgi:hypothetical protein